MKNHTPGPWHISEHGQFIRYTQADGTTANIANIGNVFGGPPDEQNANAELIARAPEMLQALGYAADLIKIARNYFPKSVSNRDRFNLENTNAAITKALKGGR